MFFLFFVTENTSNFALQKGCQLALIIEANLYTLYKFCCHFKHFKYCYICPTITKEKFKKIQFIADVLSRNYKHFTFISMQFRNDFKNNNFLKFFFSYYELYTIIIYS